MRRALRLSALAGLLAAGLPATRALAGEPADGDNTSDTVADPQHNTEEPKQAEQPAAVLQPAHPALAVIAPKVGDLSVTGYFRGGFGASNQKGRMTCFQLALPGGMHSKYRLGNECEVWSETHFTVVTYVADDGAVATLHFMPTIFIPTTYIGYAPTGVVNSPLEFTTSTGATLSFPNLYADIKGISWLNGGTAWAGTRYYKRESVYISDFFYWNPSGVGFGVEDFNLGNILGFGKDLRLSYGAFAVDGEPVSPGAPTPPLPLQTDFGIRNDVQLRGIKPFESTEIQLGFQYIWNLSANPATNGGWGVTGQWVQKLLGGENKLAFQYGQGGGTGFGTLSRFYYPDFSVRHDPKEFRFRVVEALTIEPLQWLGQQTTFVYQHDDVNTGDAGRSDWYSVGSRLSVALLKHLKAMGEAGYDRVVKANGAPPQFLVKATGALAISADRGFWARPELRIFATYAQWNEAARTAGIDSGRIYTDVYPDFLSGWNFGLQAETWW